MGQAGSQAHTFYREVAERRIVWGIRDEGGFPAPKTGEGRAMPFWSSRSRAERIIRNVKAYAGFSAVEISWADFEAHWLPGLEKEDMLVGVNWSGKRALGYDIKPAEPKANVHAAMSAGND